MVLLFLLPARPALAAAQEEASSDDAVIHEIHAEWNEAISAKDAEAAAVLYAEVAVKLLPNVMLRDGRQAIQEYYADPVEVPDFSSTFGPTRIVISDQGDLAYDDGTYVASWTGEGGPAEEEGKYVGIWPKIGGEECSRSTWTFQTRSLPNGSNAFELPCRRVMIAFKQAVLRGAGGMPALRR